MSLDTPTSRPSLDELADELATYRRRLLPITEAAKLCRCHPHTLWRHGREGRLRLVIVGHRTHVAPEELERYMTDLLMLDASTAPPRGSTGMPEG